MKIALYIEDGLEQIVLTPESETEKNILGKLHDGTRSLSIKRGSFYGCQGGWVRQSPLAYGFPGIPRDREDASTMIVLREVEKVSEKHPSHHNGLASPPLHELPDPDR